MKVWELASTNTSLSLGGNSSHGHSAVARTKRGVAGRREVREENRVIWKVSEVTSHQLSKRGRNRMEGVTRLSSRII